jgi:hypothetical protein
MRFSFYQTIVFPLQMPYLARWCVLPSGAVMGRIKQNTQGENTKRLNPSSFVQGNFDLDVSDLGDEVRCDKIKSRIDLP